MVNLGIDDTYIVERMRTLILRPAFDGETYQWWMGDSLLSEQRELVFCQQQAGTYHLTLKIIDEINPVLQPIQVVVWEEQVAYSPYISQVLEYAPAPGQFVNLMPIYEPGDTYQNMLQKVQNAIMGTNKELISLGAWGGYVTFAFDHSVVNIPHAKDFLIEGNAFLSSAMQKGGSSEPGIVMVSIDMNQNGVADDVFYQLRGSEYHHPQTIHDYAITYYKTPANHVPQGNKKAPITDSTYIRWTDNQGMQGYVKKNSFHQQDYFPQWVSDSTLSFKGTCLPDNAYDRDGDGMYYVQTFFGEGYADCNPNDSVELCSFDIDWAIDSLGNAVKLPCVDFIRVYTGVNNECGWLGETSTEISHAKDLNL